MTYDGAIIINIQVNTRDYNRGLQSMRAGMQRFARSMNNLMKTLGVGISVLGLIKLGKEALSTASDIQEVQNVVDTAFGSMSYKCEDFANTAVKEFGISKLTAKEMASTFAAMGNSMVGDLGKSTDMAIELSKRAADMASFYNKSTEETATALKAVFTGETEVLKQYGVVMTEVNLQEFAASQGINKKLSAMTQAEKVQLRYNYVMKQTSQSAGDFAKTSGSWANQTRILSEQFKELLAILGSGLISVLTPAIKMLNNVLTYLIAISKQLGEILSKTFGISIQSLSSQKALSDAEKSAGNIGDGLDGAADGAKKLADETKKAGKAAKGSLAAFDKLNVLSQNDSSNSSSSPSSATGTGTGSSGSSDSDKTKKDLGNISSMLQPIIDKLKELAGISFAGFLKGLGDWQSRFKTIKESADKIVKVLKEIFTDPKVLSSANEYIKSLANALGTFAGSVASIGLTIATNLVGGIAKYLEDNKKTIKDHLATMFSVGTEINNTFAELSASIAKIFEAFASTKAIETTANLLGIVLNTFMGLQQIAIKLARDILNVFAKPIIDNATKFKTAIEGVMGVFSKVTGTIKTSVDETMKKLNAMYDKHIKPLFDSIAKGLSSITGSILDFWNKNLNPFFMECAEKFDEFYKEHLQPLINNIIGLVGEIADLIKTLWENILVPIIQWVIKNILPVLIPIFRSIYDNTMNVLKTVADVANGIITSIRGIIKFLTGVFSGDWKKAWEGIKQIFSGILDALKSVVESALSALKKKFDDKLAPIAKVWSACWSEIKKRASDSWKNIQNVFSGIGTWFSGKFKDAVTKIKSAFSFGDFFKKAWSNIQSAFGNIAAWFRSKFSDAWEAVKKVFSSGGQVFTGIKEGILNGLKEVINKLIDGINKVVKIPFEGINTALKKIKEISIAGAKPFSGLPDVTIPKILKLANGAVIRGGDPFIAVLGDQRRGQTNVETPVSVIEKAVERGMKSAGQNGNITVQAILDGKVVYEEVVNRDNIRYSRTGKSAFAH